MGKRIVVTGGAGFIGSNFVRYIADKYPDYKITVVDLLTYAGSMDNLPEAFRDDSPDFKFWYGNVCNADLINTLVKDADYVVHFAAETHVTRSIYDNRLFFETDVIGTHTIANAILKSDNNIKRFIHISTSEVYGTALTDKMDENHPLNPMSPYASAKCGADRLVYSYYQTYDLPAVIVRPFNNYGAFQHLEKVVPRFITSVLLDEPLTVHGDGEAARDFVYVEDTCRAIDMVMHAPDEKVNGETFNVASGEDRSILSIAGDVAELMNGNKDNITFIGDRPGQVIRHTGDTSRIKSILGWEPVYSWKNGLEKTVDWYKNNKEIWEKHVWMRKIPITMANGKKGYH